MQEYLGFCFQDLYSSARPIAQLYFVLVAFCYLPLSLRDSHHSVSQMCTFAGSQSFLKQCQNNTKISNWERIPPLPTEGNTSSENFPCIPVSAVSFFIYSFKNKKKKTAKYFIILIILVWRNIFL